MALTQPLLPAPYIFLPGVKIYNIVPYGDLSLNDQPLACVLYSNYQQHLPNSYIFAYLCYVYHLHLTSTTAPTQTDFPALSLPAFQHAQAMLNTPTNNTTMAAPLSPTIPIRETRSVSTVKRSYSPSSPLVPETSDNRNYNLKDTVSEIHATIAANFTSLRQDMTTL